MYVYEQSIDSFLVVHSNWTVASLTGLVASTRATHVIIQHDSLQLYFLFRSDQLKFNLGRANSSAFLADVLPLDESKKALTIDAYTDVRQAPHLAVIVDQGQIVGVRDRDKYLGPHRGVTVAREFRADFPSQAMVNTKADLTIVLAPPRAKSLESRSVDVELDRPIEVIVSSDGAFQLAEGEAGQKIITITDIENEESVRFSFIAHSAGAIGKIRVLLMQNGNLVGHTVVAAEIKTEAVTSEIRRHTGNLQAQPVAKADLTLTILEEAQATDAVLLRFLVSAEPLGIGENHYTRVLRNTNTEVYFQTLFNDIQSMAADLDLHLASKGFELFGLFPEPLQALLCQQRERIKSIRIYSEEPWIPWELCMFSGKEEAIDGENQFFCEAFPVTRWFLNVPLIPTLSMKKVGLIVPFDSKLAYAAAERTFIESLATTERQVDNIDATARGVMDAMSTGVYDTWHFTGHGQFRDAAPNLSTIFLQQNSMLRPENINGPVKKLGRATPIVFLNGCQVGRGAMSLTGIGGWAHRFIDAQAGAFIGALWNIQDDTAFAFAKAFYTALLAGETVGEAVRLARLAIRKLGSSTWLAYTVFADSQARLRL